MAALQGVSFENGGYWAIPPPVVSVQVPLKNPKRLEMDWTKLVELPPTAVSWYAWEHSEVLTYELEETPPEGVTWTKGEGEPPFAWEWPPSAALSSGRRLGSARSGWIEGRAIAAAAIGSVRAPMGTPTVGSGAVRSDAPEATGD